MANNYKNIVVTPNIGSATDDPRIRFSGGNNTINTDITLRVYPTSNGTLSFEGSAGQLFSITNDLSGVIFSVNDISGIPSLEIDANGRISLAQFSGNVGIGTTTPSYKLDVSGDMRVTGNVTLGDASTDTIIINGSVISLGNNQSIDSGTLFIDAVNNEVGIGTTNPTSNLHVIGSANITTVLVVGTTNVVPTIQSVFANANSTHTLTVASFNAANASFANGNTNFGTTVAAFSAANASFANGNTNFTVLQTVSGVANAAFANANSTHTLTVASFNAANAAFANGNTNFTVLQTVSGVANSGWLQANAAYNNANTRLTGNTGSVGNSLLRANGTGGLTVQNSAVIVDNSGNMTGIAGLTASGTATVGNLTLSNPGVGVTSTINFAKTNDTAAIKVTEWASDLTEFQFHMSDNPESGDKFNWLIQGWQGRGNDWKPLEFTAYTTTISATKNIIDGPSFFGNQPFYAANGVKNIVFSQKTGTLNITPNVSNYVGSGLQTIYIVLDSPTTFSAYNQELYGPTQYIVSNTITGGAQTITAGITVTFSGTTGGVTGDKYWFGVWPAGRITSASGYEVSNVSVIDSGRNATFINVAATQTNTTTLLIGSLNVAPTLQAAFGAANASFANANSTHTLTIASFAAANASFANGNTNFVVLQNAFDQANTGRNHANVAFSVANGAYNTANTKFNSSGGTISGSVSINGDLFISGNTISTNASTLVIGDPLIYLASNNYTTDAVDIGFVGNYVNATGSNVHTGLYREYVSKEYYLFYGYDKEPADNHIDPNGNNFTIAVLNAAIRTSNLNLGGVNAISWLNATYTAANASFANGNTNFGTTVAAFGAANASFANGNTNFSTLQVAFGAANASFANGNTNFTVLQTVFGVANAAFANANSTHTLTIAAFNAANASFANGNTNFGTTIASFNAANASFANGNTNFSTLQVAFGAANAAFANANSTHTLTIASFAAANASFANGNTNFGTTVAAFGAANASFANGNTNFTVLQTVFGVANAAFSNANSTHTLTISAFSAANAAFANANSTHTLTIESFSAANASFANGNTNFTVLQTVFEAANASFANANSTHTLTIASFAAANAAFANSNTNFTIFQLASNVANDAYLQANTARTHANLAFGAANASFANSNTNFSTLQVASNVANDAYLQANTARNRANTAFAIAIIFG